MIATTPAMRVSREIGRADNRFLPGGDTVAIFVDVEDLHAEESLRGNRGW